jgi:hypothetical protein
MVLRQNIPKLTVEKILRIDSAPTFFAIVNLICYYSEVKTRTKHHSRSPNSLLQCLWSNHVSEQLSHVATAINLYLTSSQQPAYLVLVLCRNSLLTHKVYNVC